MLLKRLGGEVKISTEEVKALGLLKNTEVWHTSNPDDNTIKVYMK